MLYILCIHMYIYVHICIRILHILWMWYSINYSSNILPFHYYYEYSYCILIPNIIRQYNTIYFTHICTVFYILHKIHICFISISPDNVCSTSPLSALQIFTVLSLDPDTTLLPSADKATDVTQLAWPDKRYMSNNTNIINLCILYILTDMIT